MSATINGANLSHIIGAGKGVKQVTEKDANCST